MRRLALLIVFASGCDSEPTRDIFAVEGIVRGQVVDPAMNPVANAWIALDGLYPLSNGNEIPVYDSTQSDASGAYEGRLAVLNLPDTIVSYAMRVWPPAGSGLAPMEIGDLGLRVTAEPARDTVFWIIHLSP